MRIGLGVHDLTLRGGTQRQVIELACGLRAAGHEPVLYCADYNREACYGDRLEGLRVVALRTGVRTVETASSHPGLPGRLTYYARRWRSQLAEARRLAALVEPDTALFNAHDQNAGWLGCFVKERLRLPTVWMINDLPRNYFPRSHPVAAALGRAALRWNVNWFERRVARSYNRLLVLDERNRDLVRRSFGLDATVVRSGLDVAGIAFTPRAPGAPPAAPSLLCVGAFFPWRRYEDAIRAVGRLRAGGRPVRLTIVGREDRAPAYAAALRRLAAVEAPGAVTFAGDLSEGALRAAFAAADAFLFPADRQTWGLSVFEALAAGTPAIVSRGAGAHEVLTDRETALLVRPRRPAELAAAVATLLDDSELRARLATAGRRFVEGSMGWDRYAAALEEVFFQLTRPPKI